MLNKICEGKYDIVEDAQWGVVKIAIVMYVCAVLTIEHHDLGCHVGAQHLFTIISWTNVNIRRELYYFISVQRNTFVRLRLFSRKRIPRGDTIDEFKSNEVWKFNLIDWANYEPRNIYNKERQDLAYAAQCQLDPYYALPNHCHFRQKGSRAYAVANCGSAT